MADTISARQQMTVPLVTVECKDLYGPHEVRLSGHLVGYHPFDGSNSEQVADKVLASFAALLRERLGWPASYEEGA